MESLLRIKALERSDISTIIDWARNEGFAPGRGDVEIYRNTDKQGMWMGWLGNTPVGCISAIRYNEEYGFIGLYLVAEKWRRQGYGRALWNKAMDHMDGLPCIGLEAAESMRDVYQRHGFQPSSTTTRWQLISDGSITEQRKSLKGFNLVPGNGISEAEVQMYDAHREPSPRPHFLHLWLTHKAGSVFALADQAGKCHGFGRIRPSLLRKGEGWRIGPLMADTPEGASHLLSGLVAKHEGVIWIDSPGLNLQAGQILKASGFSPIGKTIRMYRGLPPAGNLEEVYGLACLELG